ncbi:hypothetical protein RchiOBHm_Chr1g0343171 [Rosa chinensis]|uniref:Uncharacterized protein n=1 Tax=Rosa chinensis TaxID=74649 RepID=A0A2P6SE85_ROSCH|nr:hypothetical protein RchiOBHm_Chr1g0343171 [Rosa chinensis]
MLSLGQIGYNLDLRASFWRVRNRDERWVPVRNWKAHKLCRYGKTRKKS